MITETKLGCVAKVVPPDASTVAQMVKYRENLCRTVQAHRGRAGQDSLIEELLRVDLYLSNNF